jgi:hypothetical protein
MWKTKLPLFLSTVSWRYVSGLNLDGDHKSASYSSGTYWIRGYLWCDTFPAGKQNLVLQQVVSRFARWAILKSIYRTNAANIAVTWKVKVKLSLRFNWTPRHEGILGEWRYSSTHSLTSALDGGEWSASRPRCFTPREGSAGTHWIGG